MKKRVALFVAVLTSVLIAEQPTLPTGPLVIRDFTLQFNAAGTYSLSGQGWPSMAGSWVINGGEVTLQMSAGPNDCRGAGRYRFVVDGARVAFDLISDDCVDQYQKHW